MKYTRGTQIAIAVILTTGLIIGCSGVDDGVNGEESNTELALNETYDKIRNGARLILTYDAQSNSLQRYGGKHHRRNPESSSS